MITVLSPQRALHKRSHMHAAPEPVPFRGQPTARSRYHDGCPFAGFYASEANAPSKEDARAVLLRALELGINFYNTSNLYGPYVNEDLIGAPSVPSCRATGRCWPLTAVAGVTQEHVHSVRAFDCEPCGTSGGWSSITWLCA